MQAFELLKTLMCQWPVLAQPNYSKPCIIHTDMSGYGVGAILLQEGDTNPEHPHKFRLHPIAYYFATFIPAKRNYDIYELVDSTRCPACGLENKTVMHYLLKCAGYAHERWSLKEEANKLSLRINLESLLGNLDLTIPLANFIDTTHRFKPAAAS
jgi:RNase H-like domain found in reverse transcriptase